MKFLCSTSHNSKKKKNFKNQVSINRTAEWVCVYSGIPLSAKRGPVSETCNNLEDLKDTMLKEARYKRVCIA